MQGRQHTKLQSVIGRFSDSLALSISPSLPAFSTAELHRMVAVQNLVREPAESNLAWLEALYAAMRRESPDGIYSGEECVIQALCEFCEAAAANLIDVLHRCPTSISPGAPGLQQGIGVDVEVTIGKAGTSQVCVLASVLRRRALAYLDGARHWAVNAYTALGLELDVFLR